jgi:hypothetical protein
MKTRDRILTIIILVFTAGLVIFYNINTRRLIDKHNSQINNLISSKSSNITIPTEPLTKDKNGNYILSAGDWHRLEDYIIYQSQRNESAIQLSQTEISQDVERLNMWISIWIGILGLFGAIIPFLVNFAATKDFDKKIKDLEEKAEKIPEIDNAVQKSETALKNSNETQNILKFINTISNLRHIEEFHRISTLLRLTKEEFLAMRFLSFKKSFMHCKANNISPTNNPIFNECIQDFCLATMQIRSLLTKRNHQENLSRIETDFQSLLNSKDGIDESLYNKILSSFDELILSLKN